MISISTNMYANLEDWEQFQDLTDLNEVGFEIFPLWQFTEFDKILKKYESFFLERKLSFHSPYYLTEPSLSPNEPLYKEMIEKQEKTIKWAKKLRADFIVFHHNNRKINGEKSQLLKNSKALYKKLHLEDMPQLVENVGINRIGNMLLNQEEFIEYCKKENVPVLLDLGHIHCNGWDTKKLLLNLKNQIVAYHLHNNDGTNDEHHRILDGTYSMEEFMKLRNIYTPNTRLILEYSPNIQVKKEELIEDINWLKERL